MHKQIKTLNIWLIFVFFFFSGCAGPKTISGPPPYQGEEKAVQTARSQEDKPREDVEFLKVFRKEEVEVQEAGADLLNREVEITATDVPLAGIVLWLLEGTEYKPIYEDGVDGLNVNFILKKKVKVKDALRYISRQLDITYTIDSKDKLIGFKKYLTKVFYIPYQPIRETFETTVKNSSAPSNVSGGDSSTGQTGSTTGSTGQTDSTTGSTGQTGSTDSSLVLNVSKERPAFWDNFEQGLKTILMQRRTNPNPSPTGALPSPDIMDRTSYTADRITGTVVITATPSIMDRVTTYINEINSSLQKAVEVNLTIAEVSLSDGFEFGVDWEYLKKELGQVLLSTSSTFSEYLPTTGFNPVVLTLESKNNPDLHNVVLRALKSQGDVNIINRPRLIVRNNTTAGIEVANTVNYIASITSTVTGTTGTVQQSVTSGTVKDGMVLHFTPRVMHDGEISINISPFLSTLVEMRSVSIGEGNVIELPQKNDRNLVTTINIKNGSTVVIGGLISNKSNNVRQGVPFLSDIPVIGGIFSHTKKEKEKKEVVITLTARII